MLYIELAKEMRNKVCEEGFLNIAFLQTEFRCLGAGAHSSVYEIEGKAFKVAANDRGYTEFVRFCSLFGKSKHLPHFYFRTSISKGITVTVMPIYEAISARQYYNNISNIIGIPRKRTAEEHYLIRAMDCYKENKNLYTDYHSGNFMMKDKNWIVTDPWCS